MLTPENLAILKQKLLDEKDLVIKTLSKINLNVDSDLKDEVDIARVMEEHKKEIKIRERSAIKLKMINHALKKIDLDEDYGYCEGTGDLISINRLMVQPWCKYLVKYQEEKEKQQKYVRGYSDGESEITT